MADEVGFLEMADWPDTPEVGEVERSLKTLGFRATSEVAGVASMSLLARGWLHRDRPFAATVFQSESLGCWCELFARNRKADYYVVSAIPTATVWPAEPAAHLRRPGAAPDELLAALEELTDPWPLARPDAQTFALELHSRLEAHREQFLGDSPAQRRAREVDRRARLRALVAEHVGFFRPLGFFTDAAGLADDALLDMVVEYDAPLFERFPGAAAMCDDFDDLAALFTFEELESMPTPTMATDLKLLTLLDPMRVRWRGRGEPYRRIWGKKTVERRCAAEGLHRVGLELSGPEDDPFADRYELLLPVGAEARLRERGWLLPDA